MRVKNKNIVNHKNIVIGELADIVIKEVKKPEVKKPNVINIMDEDNDNDQNHDFSDIKQLKLFFKKMKKKLFKN